MITPKNKPIIPRMRLLVRACPYLPPSIAFTVDHAKNASTIAGMRKMRNTIRIMKNGNALTLVGGVVGKLDLTVEIDVAKIKPTIRRTRMPIAAVMT